MKYTQITSSLINTFALIILNGGTDQSSVCVSGFTMKPTPAYTILPQHQTHIHIQKAGGKRNQDRYAKAKKDEDYFTRLNMLPEDGMTLNSRSGSTNMSGSKKGTGTPGDLNRNQMGNIIVGRQGGKRHSAARSVASFFSSLPLLSSTDSNASTGTDSRSRISILEQENEILRQAVASLEKENLVLEKNQASKRIIMEQFEGEGKPMFDVNGTPVDPTWWEENAEGNVEKNGQSRDSSSIEYTLVDNPSILQSQSALSDDNCEEDGCPIEPDLSFKAALKDRATWLVGLLTLQSMSGFILARNEQLLQTHPVIVYFLTMLVGAGGNAGNQAAVRVIRGIALGTLNESTQQRFLNREFKMAISLSVILSCAGFIRAAVFRTPFAETVAVTTALAIIVFISICLGAVLPLLLRKIDVDPAHSSTTIQVIMDILGVVLTVFVSSTLLDTAFGQQLISKLSWGG